MPPKKIQKGGRIQTKIFIQKKVLNGQPKKFIGATPIKSRKK